MFSNLSQGSVLYGIETKGELKLFTAPIDSITFPRPKDMNPTFGQTPQLVVDIIATVNGERREFRQVPCNTTIADFGPNTVVLADSRESLNGYLASTIQNKKNTKAALEELNRRIPEYERIYGDLNGSLNPSANEETIKQLQEEIGSMKSQMSEMLSLLKSENNKT